ncbi:MAG: MFS transporter [SAR202 cluster bacterium]|nr:MFS transporter [SAR202 cluster bacterium]
MANKTAHDAGHRVLRLSTLEGMAAGGVAGTGERFLSAYGLALGATDTQLALLASVPSWFRALAQPLASRAVAALGGRKRIVVTFAMLGGFAWLPILALGLASTPHIVYWLVAFATLCHICNALVGPVWSSIMAEIVPPRLRGRYFGRRSRWTTIASMAAFLAAGGILSLMKVNPLAGFMLIFAIACLLRFVSVFPLRTLTDPPLDPRGDNGGDLLAFARRLPSTNLGRLVLYMFAVHFFANLAGPFFVPYTLRELGIGYLTYTLLEWVSIAVTVLVVTNWGVAADLVGNRRMLAVAGLLVAVSPLLWIVSGNIVVLVVAEALLGFAWAGFDLTSGNFLLDASTSRDRTSTLAYVGAGTALAASLGALAGGALASHVPPLGNGSQLQTMFLISGVLRLGAWALFMPMIREVHDVAPLAPLAPLALTRLLMGGMAARGRPTAFVRASTLLIRSLRRNAPRLAAAPARRR